MDNFGCVRIADFGLAKVTQNLDSVPSASRQQGHTPRWAAPEILKEEGPCSKESDIFSFAMVMIEVRYGWPTVCKPLAYYRFVLIQVFIAAVPFSGCSSFVAAIAIVQGKRPPQPTHPAFTEDVWALVQRCWNQEPHLRPQVREVLEALRTLSIPRQFLQQLHHLDVSSPGFHDQLNDTLYGEEYQQCAPNLQGNDLIWLVDYLDKVPRRISLPTPHSS